MHVTHDNHFSAGWIQSAAVSSPRGFYSFFQELHGDDEADDGGEGDPVGVGEALDEEAEADGGEDDRENNGHGRFSVTGAGSASGARSVRTQLPSDFFVNSSANFQSA